MTPEQLKTIVATGFGDAERIETAGEGNKFDVRVVDVSFEGKRPVARQQAVFALVGDYIASGEIHALNIQALTPSEWQEKSRFG